VKFLLGICKLLDLKRDALLLDAFSKVYSAYEIDCLSGQLTDLQEKFAQKWESHELNALIAPVTASVAFKHG
jgi:hypothetical protein